MLLLVNLLTRLMPPTWSALNYLKIRSWPKKLTKLSNVAFNNVMLSYPNKKRYYKNLTSEDQHSLKKNKK